MITHIELDDQLIKQVMQLCHFSTKKAAVQAALAEFVKTLKREQLLELRDKVRWQADRPRLRSEPKTLFKAATISTRGYRFSRDAANER